MAKILLGVSAGIAAYKSADLASTLTRGGHTVVTLMTPNALEFIAPLTFRAVTRQRVYTDTFEDAPGASTEHVSLAQWGDLLVVAPATADIIARLAAGMASDIISTTALAFPGPVVICPSMNDQMWSHPLVGENIERLRRIGHTIVAPESGHLACGSHGPGRLPPTADIVAAIERALETAAG